jgi:outer membrane biosynthesis protein TonB
MNPSGTVYYSGIGGVTAPELIAESKLSPKFPDKGRRAGVSARCILQPVITKEGAVGPLEVISCVYASKKDGSVINVAWPRQSDDYGFAQASFDAVKKWRYKPATLDGQAIDAYFTVVVTFVLD